MFLVQQVDPRWAPPTPAPDGKTKYEVRDLSAPGPRGPLFMHPVLCLLPSHS